jgi:ferredoxin
VKVGVDADRCVGHGLCYSQSPEVFEDDEEGYSHVRFEGDLPAGLEAGARVAAANCPERAIDVT